MEQFDKKDLIDERIIRRRINGNQYRQEMRDVARDIGNCTKCYQEKGDPNFALCQKCRSYNQAWSFLKKKEKNK